MSTLALMALFLVGCGVENQTSTPASTQTGVVDEESPIIGVLTLKITSMEQELDLLRQYTANDPEYFLFLMDQDLDAVEQGGAVVGSFSDYFVPNAAKAFAAGAAPKAVDDRINRVITLAEQGIYLSSHMKTLMDQGGPGAVRSYVKDWINQ
jgi:hypothetical protein